jgi:uncharacterized protein (TIGR03905 family)
VEYSYKTKGGVCSRMIRFTIDNGVVQNIRFEGGCDGNTQGVGRLAEGMKAEELVARLRHIRCGAKDSSCPDQLATAVEEALRETAQAPADGAGADRADNPPRQNG